MRRAIAVILTLVLANVNVARALACDDLAIAAQSGVSEQAPAHGSGHEHHAPLPEAPTPEQDSAPAQCCQAMTSCVMTGDLAVQEQRTGTPIVTELVPGDLLAAPLVRLTAPEPPPPKV